MKDPASFKSSILVACVLLLAAPQVASTSMMEPHRERTAITYVNGDELVIECPPEQTSCVVTARVNGVGFRFSQEEVGGAILPFGGRLFSGEHSGRDQYFSLELSVECPDGSDSMCEATILIEPGIDAKVSIYRAK